jgi:cytochrome c peroxidase
MSSFAAPGIAPVFALTLGFFVGFGGGPTLVAPAQADGGFETKEALGDALFHDVALSKNRTEACATCHMPDNGFVDARGAEPGGAASLGDDGVSLGNRNAPTATYAALTPPFTKRPDGTYVGGQFLDGRASTLADQAVGPPLNPAEMGMPDAASVVARLKENATYVAAFDGLFKPGVLDDPKAGYAAMGEAIAAYEGTETFSTFDSKYDRVLRGEDHFTDQEELGRTLFFSQQFTNCNQCHQLNDLPGKERELFTDHSYHNIGVPANKALNAARKSDAVDLGLFENPAVDDPAMKGKFKVTTLRNVAVTGPYMHNGVFKDLRTVILFYNKYNSRNPARQINPETGEPWGPPEVVGTLSQEKLEMGPALDDQRIDALVAFLKTLTDRRYEQLLGE